MSDSKIKLSNVDTELLKKALEEAAEQASVPTASGTTQFMRKKAEPGSGSSGNTGPARRKLF